MDIRERIFAAAEETVDVFVPDWNLTVKVRRLPVQDALDVLGDKGKPTNRRAAELVVKAVVDADGRPIFTEADIETLANGRFGMPLLILNRAAMTHNNMDNDADERAGKASAPTAGGASCSGSPATSDAPSAS